MKELVRLSAPSLPRNSINMRSGERNPLSNCPTTPFGKRICPVKTTSTPDSPVTCQPKTSTGAAPAMVRVKLMG